MRQRLLNQLPPFIFIGIILAMALGLFILFVHVILWGILLGSILWVCSLIGRFFSTPHPYKKRKGRIINHE